MRRGSTAWIPAEHPSYALVVVLGDAVRGLPASNETKRFASVLLRAEPPADDSPRAIYRFRRATEPWALEALAYLRAGSYADAVRAARAADPAEPLLRGDELGLAPGPDIGRLLDLVEEERAAGTISTREEALELVRQAQKLAPEQVFRAPLKVLPRGTPLCRRPASSLLRKGAHVVRGSVPKAVPVSSAPT